MAVAMRTKPRAFSLVELVIVVVIIGIIGAIAIPRLSRGSTSASENALRGNLSVLRRAVELYAAEHDGKFPTDVTSITNQLIQYSDASGAVSATKTLTHVYGPYIAREIPALPIGSNKGQRAFVATQGGTTAGWVYDSATGAITANLPATEKDTEGNAYSTY
ncbi:MAG: prepilin-type N-terminal cleavage/methylation domain-containing protein [Phycisphaeraceae bacterium]|nr:prepilin-type N-terminal cleavage/methylation domain-containing protein [Phycisphaeraceae bacterium]